jgi:hypothetical protein
MNRLDDSLSDLPVARIRQRTEDLALTNVHFLALLDELLRFLLPAPNQRVRLTRRVKWRALLKIQEPDE